MVYRNKMPRRADINNTYIKWEVAYGENIDARAENILNGNFPDTVTNGNRPATGQANEFVFEDNENSIEVQDINFTEPYIGHINPNDEVLYVRSQRYGEIVANTRSHGNNDRGVIDGILKSVYAVTFDQPIIDAPAPTACTCDSQYTNDNGNCKHMQAAQQFLQQNPFPDNFGDDDDNIMEDDEYGGFNPNEAAEVQDVDAFADGTIGGRLRQRRMTERQGPRRSTRQRRSTRRSGGTLDGDIFVSSFASSQNQLYECVEELEKLKL